MRNIAAVNLAHSPAGISARNGARHARPARSRFAGGYRHALALAIALAAAAPGSLRAQDGRALAGIAHVALRVSDVPKLRAFYQTLGWVQAFEFSDDKGTATSYVKVSDRQFIELYRRNNPAEPLGLMHICFEAGDLDRVHAAYQALGLDPTPVRKARAGNLLFNLRDPEGQTIEYTQYLPGSLHSEDHGKHLSGARISDHMIAVLLAAKDPGAEKIYFIAKLGFAGTGLQLAAPGRADEVVELRPLAAGAPPELRFAADPKLAAGELEKRGIEAKKLPGAVEVRDPDGTVLIFAPQP